MNELLARFADRVSSVLDARLVGIYLTGSFALGGGDAASDCDFLAVTDGPLSEADESGLRRLHEEIPSWPGYWAHNLEGSYAPQGDLETLASLGRPWLYVDRGSREPAWSPHCNTADVRWVVVNRPLVLTGRERRTFVHDVPADVVRAETRPRLENVVAELRSWAPFDLSWTQRYAVEASTRMLYTLEHGEVISKQDALDWATETAAPEWRDLIEQVRRDRFVRWDAPPRPASMERSLDYVEHVQARARAHGW